MTDIVKRLRHPLGAGNQDIAEAAAEIERLRAALQAVDDVWSNGLEFKIETQWQSQVGKAWALVKAALEDKP